jgi:Zn-dependent protease
MFLNQLRDDPTFFFSVLITVIVSITLHELAHGWAALWQGDDTPVAQDRMGFNPLVHMGWPSLILLATTGMAFGTMPIDPARFRSRFGEALVAAAGPAMNLLLGLLGLSAAGFWIHSQGLWDALPPKQAALQHLVWYFGTTNLTLAILNLLPIPPLDGAHILANFVPPFRALTERLMRGAGFGIALVVVLVLLSNFDLGIGQLSAKLSIAFANRVFHTRLYLPAG